ncbi:hypothetical protein C8R42DRAFT_776090 [Lentinula raphanica]|nr:hypothetical protein C8R42DRAFT_776090 [Lentinula raphanica]
MESNASEPIHHDSHVVQVQVDVTTPKDSIPDLQSLQARGDNPNHLKHPKLYRFLRGGAGSRNRHTQAAQRPHDVTIDSQVGSTSIENLLLDAPPKLKFRGASEAGNDQPLDQNVQDRAIRRVKRLVGDLLPLYGYRSASLEVDPESQFGGNPNEDIRFHIICTLVGGDVRRFRGKVGKHGAADNLSYLDGPNWKWKKKKLYDLAGQDTDPFVYTVQLVEQPVGE